MGALSALTANHNSETGWIRPARKLAMGAELSVVATTFILGENNRQCIIHSEAGR